MALTKPSLIDRDASAIVQEMIAFYEAATGKTLQPGQPERLLINAFAYREVLLRNAIQSAAEQNLVSFAVFPMLDKLGELLGVERLAASAAEVTVTFSLIAGHGALVLPQGTRVASTDGKVIFETKESFSILISDSDVNVDCICQQSGVVGNGYIAGTITNILDPQAYITGAANADTSGGGSDEETDDQLRERIKLAPSAFSSAGSVGAYKYHAFSANPSIIDVAVVSNVPGTVQIYPLVEGGIVTPGPILAAVLVACSAEKVRPLTDTVTSASPTAVNYAIEVELLLYTDAEEADILSAVGTALTDYVANQGTKLGKDIVVNQIIGLCQVPGVYKVTVVQPAVDVVINETSFGKNTGITVTPTGFTNG